MQRESFERWRRWSITAVVALAVLAAVSLGFFTRPDKQDLQQAFIEERRRAGEPVEMADFIPPPVPDAENFALTPLLAPLLDYQPDWSAVTREQPRPKAIFREPQPRVLEVTLYGSRRRTPVFKATDWQTGMPADLAALQDSLRENAEVPVSTASAAEDALLFLARFEPELEELRAAAVTRRQGRFPLHYEGGAHLELRHLTAVLGVGRVLNLHAVALMAQGRSEEALADLRVVFAFADALKQEPAVSQLIRGTSIAYVLPALWEGIAAQRWSEAQLAEVQNWLGTVDLLAGARLHLLSQRALLLEMKEAAFSQTQMGMRRSQDRPADELARPAMLFLNPSIVVRTARRMTDEILPAIDVAAHRVRPELWKTPRATPSPEDASAWNMANDFLGNFGPGVTNLANRAATVDLARVACTLERWRLRRGSLPATLAELAGVTLERVPHDVFDGQPLHYVPTSGGGYVIYSVGWDQQDDGGTPAAGRDDPGDVVWRINRP